MQTTSKALLGKGKKAAKDHQIMIPRRHPTFIAIQGLWSKNVCDARATMQSPQEVLKACENIQWTEMSIKFFAFYLLSVIRTFMGSVRKCVYLAR